MALMLPQRFDLSTKFFQFHNFCAHAGRRINRIISELAFHITLCSMLSPLWLYKMAARTVARPPADA